MTTDLLATSTSGRRLPLGDRADGLLCLDDLRHHLTTDPFIRHWFHSVIQQVQLADTGMPK